MATRVIDDIKLNDIAVAIQAKDNGGQMTVDEMPDRIGALQIAEPVVENPALALVDWEGTILKEYSKEDALALTELPTPSSFLRYNDVDHELLLFQEWNWNLADIKEEINSANGFWFNNIKIVCVTAIYTTADDQEHKYWDDPRLEGIESEVSIIKTNKTSNLYYNGYRKLRAINIPYGTTKLLSNAFYNCSSLVYIGAPSSISQVYTNTFQNCIRVKKISLPKDCYSGGGQASYISCSSLEMANCFSVFGTIDNSFFLTKAIMPDEIKKIASSAFLKSYNLKTVHLKKQIETINNWAFENCYSLTDFVLESMPVLTNSGNFNNTNPYLKIYVPQNYISWFETATNWSTLYAQNKIVTIEDNIIYLESIGIDVDEYKGGS